MPKITLRCAKCFNEIKEKPVIVNAVKAFHPDCYYKNIDEVGLTPAQVKKLNKKCATR